MSAARRPAEPAEVLLTISQVSRRAGIAASALRYYESRGLIASRRASSGHRRFPRSVLRRLAFVVFAQRLGMSLDEVGDALGRLPTDHIPTGEDWSRLAAPWRARIDARIAELERLREGLSSCIGCGCLSLRECGLLNPDDRVGQTGAGPRAWVASADFTPPADKR